MTERFWIVMGLLAIVAIASIHLGYKWGRHVEHNVWTNDFLEKFNEMPNGEEFVELFQSIHDEIEKEIDDEDTHSS